MARSDVSDRLEHPLNREWVKDRFPPEVFYMDHTSDPDADSLWRGPRLHLPDEPGVHDFHRSTRPVRTASVQQVRAPISTARVGAAAAYRRHMDAFHAAYGA